MNTNDNGNDSLAARIAGNLDRAYSSMEYSAMEATGPSTTTTIAGANTLGYYPYQYPYYADYNLANRVASLEGEVRVLREMVAALLSGKAPKASSAKR